MNCADIQALLAEYLGEELEQRRCQHFDAHLQSCEKCAAEVAGLRAVLGELRELPAVSADDAAQRTTTLQLRPPRRRSRIHRLVSAALRSAALLALGVALGWFLKPDHRLPTADSLQRRPDPPAVLTQVHPAWRQAAEQARQSSAGTSFARKFAALSAAKRGA